MNDTRKEGRLPVTLLARYREPTMLEPREGECKDLSPGGMFIMTPRPSPRGALVRFECMSPNSEEIFRGTGRVVWQRNKSDPRGPAGMGIRFVRLESGGREALQHILERVHLERQRDRAEAGRRTSSGPPPRVRSNASDPVTQGAPILPTSGNGAPSSEAAESKSDLRQGTIRGVGVSQSDGPVARAFGAAPRSAVAPAPSHVPPAAPANLRSPLPPSSGSSGPPPGGSLGSTLMDGTPSPAAAAITTRSPLPPPLDSKLGPAMPSPLPPPNPEASSLSATLRTHASPAMPSAAPASTSVPVRAPDDERLDRTRRGYASDPAETTPNDAGAKGQRPTKSAASVAPKAVAERVNRPSDRPPAPGGVDDLRVRASASAAREPPTNAESATRPVEIPSIVPDPPRPVWPRLQPDEGSTRAPSYPPEGDNSRRQLLLWIVLGSGLLVAGIVAKLFATSPLAVPQSPSEEIGAPLPSSSVHDLQPAPAVAAPALDLSRAPDPVAAPAPEEPAPSATKPPLRAPAATQAPSAVKALGPPPAPSTHREEAAAPAPSAAGPAPSASPAAPAAAVATTVSPEPSPLEQALDCLSRGDNRCVIRALEDKASNARELELLIATYRAVGSTPRAEREMKHYLESFPGGQHANEYKRLLSLRTEDATPATAAPVVAPTIPTAQ